MEGSALVDQVLTTPRSAAEIVGDSEHIRVDSDGLLWVENVSCVDLVDRFGTPLYVTSETAIRSNYRRLHTAFASRYPKVTILFATKANSNVAVRQILAQEGSGGDCFGMGELTMSLRAGITPSKLVLNGSNKTLDELTIAVTHGVPINLDHPAEFQTVSALAESMGQQAVVNLRVLPFSYADFERLPPDMVEIASDRSHDKWGMDRETILKMMPDVLRSPWVQLAGLHMHVSRLRSTTEPFELGVALVAECIAELRAQFDWEPNVLDIGGGFAHERDPAGGYPAWHHEVASPEEYAEAIVSALRDALGTRGLAEPHLMLEPGRRLVGNATVLLATVGVTKRLPTGTVTWVNVDASTSLCLRTSLEGYYYEVVHATRGRETPTLNATITGPTCVADILGEDRWLPEVRQGELLAVLDVGAYAEVLSNQFNMVPRPASVLVLGSEVDTIRRRETIEDVQAGQQIPPRLLA